MGGCVGEEEGKKKEKSSGFMEFTLIFKTKKLFLFFKNLICTLKNGRKITYLQLGMVKEMGEGEVFINLFI